MRYKMSWNFSPLLARKSGRRRPIGRGPEWLSPEVVERVEHQLAIVSQNREGNSALVRS